MTTGQFFTLAVLVAFATFSTAVAVIEHCKRARASRRWANWATFGDHAPTGTVRAVDPPPYNWETEGVA